MSDDPISFTDWLTDALPISDVPESKYRHRRLDENRELREQVLPRLKEKVQESLKDMVRALINPYQNSLDHFPQPQRPAIADLYPQELPIKTKMGYFGEYLAGVLCVEFEAFGESNWEIPAYLFRWHEPAIRYLERVRDKDATGIPQEVYGRQGDDCLVFQRAKNGDIISFVACEAKCLSAHDIETIREAHWKLSKSGNVAEDRIQVIKILEERQRQDPNLQTQQWIDALYKMEFAAGPFGCERYDLICYICGQVPIRRESWISRNTPMSDYKGDRNLEAIEVHIGQVNGLVLELYGKCQREQPNDESD